MPTIFAQASARGKSGVAVVRISGPAAWDAVRKLAGDIPALRHAGLRRLHRRDGEPIDDALIITFAKGASFTGEMSAEVQLHGSPAAVSAVLRELSMMDGLRLAEPGEFTRRALENGRLDLAQVEGLADLIEAETEAQRRQALRVLSGALGKKAADWRRSLLRAAALLAATIDFADEDVPMDVAAEVAELLLDVATQAREEAKGARVSERIRDGFEVAIVGPPNVGKSTLLNALAGREAALTSEFAGTTRDVIEVRMDLDGLPVSFLDTAGLRSTENPVESLGIERALERASAADLRVFLVERGDEALPIVPAPEDLVLLAKADLRHDAGGAAVSGLTGEGIGRLIARISATLEKRAAGAATAIRERHRKALLRGVSALELALVEVERGPDRAELAAEEVHRAIRALDSLIGKIDVENVFDEIFASFCLGK